MPALRVAVAHMFRTRRRVVAAGGSVSVALYLAYRAGWLRRLLRRSAGKRAATCGPTSTAPPATDAGCGTATAAEAAKANAAKTKNKRKRVGIDGEFWRRLRKLLKVVFPKLLSRPTLLLALHSTYLLV